MGLFEQIAAGLTLVAETAARVRPEFERLSTAAAQAEGSVTSSMSRIRDEAEAAAAAVHGITTGGNADSGMGALASDLDSQMGR